MKKGILYVTWGSNIYSDELEANIKNSKMITDLPVCVITNQKNLKVSSDDIVYQDFNNKGDKHGFNFKTLMYQLSPFDNTLYLDTDAFLLKDPSYGFEMSNLHDLALTYTTKDPCLNHSSLSPANLKQYVPHYNGGVLFFSKSSSNKDIFSEWFSTCSVSETIPQVELSQIITNKKKNPFILPYIWNYRPHYGLQIDPNSVYIWHSRDIFPNKEIESFYKTADVNITRLKHRHNFML